MVMSYFTYDNIERSHSGYILQTHITYKLDSDARIVDDAIGM